MKKGLSLMEMLITLAVVAMIIVTLFQVFITIHSTLNKSKSKMRDFTLVRYQIVNQWVSGSIENQDIQITVNDSFFDKLTDMGVSSELLGKLESAIVIMNVYHTSSGATYTAVVQQQ